jgi:RND family efflux transporter MFP subunit
MRGTIAVVTVTLLATACGGGPAPAPSNVPAPAGAPVLVTDTTRPDQFAASGVAQPIEQATLSTRLMATITEVVPIEGARVTAGEVLVRLDARDLDAKRQQAAAALAEATAGERLARVTAERIRALYADSAAPKAQLDAAEAGLSRATAGLAAAHAAVAELEATARYAEVRAPFAGVVTRRFVDPGAFAAPGAPLLTVASSARLRIVATVPATLVAGLRPGRRLEAQIEGQPAVARLEGAVPSAGNLYTVNALVENPDGRFLAGSAATLLVPTGERRVVLVPTAALIRQGDLIGVHRRLAGAAELTWITVGGQVGDRTEVLSGLAAGDTVLVAAGGS